MIQIFLEEDLVPFESDIRELLKAFYPGEDFQLHTPDGVRLMETTQEEKNALKRAKARGEAVPVNKKSLKRKNQEKENQVLTEEGISDPSLFRLTLDLRGLSFPLTGERAKDKSIVKARLYQMVKEKSGRSLPWGDLTGIRPVSLAGKLLREGEKATEALSGEEQSLFYRALKEEYCLEEKRRNCFIILPKGKGRF